MWTPETLEQFAAEALGARKVVVVSNREPYMHYRESGEIRWIKPAGGLVAALDPVLRAVGGIWIAHGAGTADRATADSSGRLSVPPDEKRYTLRRVWLSKREEEGYYFGLSNEALWPLCHVAFVRPLFRQADWAIYESVNRKFAAAVLEEVGSAPALVLVQDYHLALLPKLLREARPDLGIAHFWHIPWPNPEIFRICPWRRDLLEGILGNDLIGFHLQYHCLRFLESVEGELQVRIDREHQCIFYGDRVTYVRSFPIGTDAQAISDMSQSDEVTAEIASLWRLLSSSTEVVGVSVDRLDYTKGVPERLQAIDRFLSENPSWRGRVQFLAVAAPSRIHIQTYQNLGDQVSDLVEDINWRHGSDGWQPLITLQHHVGVRTAVAIYRLGHVCLVTSLHDGMNLVAKEYVAARADGDGVLLLSRFTGSARDFPDAILVNPYDVAGMATALAAALEMPEEERRARMARMRAQIFERNVYDWARRVFDAAVRRADASPPALMP
ncbi:MAG: trehalose-6-phosphate synthase [Planctomycetota bacterium]